MNIEELKERQCLLFECISGSQAYGLATEMSDVDIRGVFVIPEEDFYSFDYPEQISDEKNNIIYFELKKFLGLLAKNNPTMLELLYMPEDCILYEHPLYQKITSFPFLSRLCKESFGNYAVSQIKKARGLNKKIVNPVGKQRKSILDFCYVLKGKQTVPLQDYLNAHGLSEKKCGLVALDHMRDLYAIYYSESGHYKGIEQHSASMDVALSSVPKEAEPMGILSFNKDGYIRYCKDYKEYWDWVGDRNEARYRQTLEHGKNYDAKNMMHVFRLLDMAKEIGLKGALHVRQSDPAQLLRIKNGEYGYDELLGQAEGLQQEIEEIYQSCPLPEKPDIAKVNRLLVDIRKSFYHTSEARK